MDVETLRWIFGGIGAIFVTGCGYVVNSIASEIKATREKVENIHIRQTENITRLEILKEKIDSLPCLEPRNAKCLRALE